jgi:hypothetical protein
MSDFLTEISPLLQAALVTVLTVVLPLALKYAHTWLQLKQAELEAGIPQDRLYASKELIRELVLAADHNGVNGHLAKIGKTKLDYVMALAQSELRQQGIDIDLSVLRGLVEAAVWREFGKQPEQPPAAG